MLGTSLGASLLLALADPDRVPNDVAIAMAPTVGWLLLACALCVALLFLLQSERWRRFWLTNEDPRPIALFRIVFAFLCICNINDLWEYFDFLFTDEGIFLSDAARQHFASGQLRGYGDGLGGDPRGFFDLPALLEYLKGPKYSLLFFWDTPTGMRTQLLAFYAAATLFMVGWRSRVTGVLTFLLMNSFFVRNQLFWEGTELVYRVFFIYLLCARSGHAYSVDNWLRCRALRRAGLLSTREGPGGGAGLAPSPEHPRGLQAVYRLIPAWPRILMMLNLGVLYCYTGAVKNGSVWSNGDALYYALNMDHFYRFYPQEISSIPWVGAGLFRLATWITHWWEALFPLLIFGIVARWSIREKLEPLRGARLWAVRACWLALGVLAMNLVLYTLPVHLAPVPDQWPLPVALRVHASAWIVGMALVGGLWWILGRRPPALTIRGRRRVLDRDWLCRWFLGRRVWLTLGLIFHGNLQVLMNIGMFPPIMMSTYLFVLQGDEPGRILRFFGRGLGRALPWLPLPADVRRGEPPLPAEDRTLPHHIRDSRRLPGGVLAATLVAVLLGVVLHATPLWPWLKVHVLGLEGAAVGPGIHFGRTLAVIAALLFLYTYAQGHRGTRAFALKLAGAVLAVGGYAWLMSAKGTTTATRDALTFARIGFHAAVLLALVLRRIPAVDRALSRVGLTFTAPERAAQDPGLPAVDPRTGHPTPPWSYGPGGRLLVTSLALFHVVAIAIWVLPDKDCLSSFRSKAREPFSAWVLATQTDQGWGMFAPNPPRSNVFMRTVLTDENGEAWDMRTDLYARERMPIPWVWNDRMRKMNRRIIGGESGGGAWYQQWYARYLCRAWALAHRGVMPQKVELYKVSYNIPSPDAVTTQGWYAPERLLDRTGRQFVEHTTTCATAEHGQLPNFIRERHDLPLLPDGVFKARTATKKSAWDKRYDPPREGEGATPTRTPVQKPPPATLAPAETPQMND